MTILADHKIVEYVDTHQMIVPFVPALVREGDGRKIISYGLSSHGYDMRCTEDFRLCRAWRPAAAYPMLDPKNIVLDAEFEKMPVNTDHSGRYVILPPGGLALTASAEYWRIPRNIQVVTFGKSTYARVGVIVNVTPMEAGWEGNLTIELSNTSPVPVRIYCNEGIAQAIFHEADPCTVSYADRNGKYQNTRGVVAARA